MKMVLPMLYFTYIFLIIYVKSSAESTANNIPQKLIKGFKITPNPTVTNFQPILTDSTGNFSLSFLRVNQEQLALAIVHVPSGESFWQANSSELAQWGKQTQLLFNGSLVISDSKSGVFWSSNSFGDYVMIGEDSNLKIIKGQNDHFSDILWQSFDFPYDTLVEGQNLTSDMSLLSLNRIYTMRLGFDFIGLYAKFKGLDVGFGSDLDQIYYKHRAWKVKANIVLGNGPITIRVSSDGFLGMYQNSSIPADIQAFSSYQRSVIGPRRVRIESDGNLKGYYWSGSNWITDYMAITDPCELPNPCGSYGLCTPGEGCSCLDNNKTRSKSGQCHSVQLKSQSLDICKIKENKYTEFRRTGVELPFKELMPYTNTSYEQCEKSCAMNCTCWGALYNNASGFCYYVDYPIKTILGMGDNNKIGYFKVWENVEKKGDKWLWIGIGLLCGAIIVIFSVLGFACYKLSNKNTSMENRYLNEENIIGSYKDLGACSSFGSIELSNK